MPRAQTRQVLPERGFLRRQARSDPPWALSHRAGLAKPSPHAGPPLLSNHMWEQRVSGRYSCSLGDWLPAGPELRREPRALTRSEAKSRTQRPGLSPALPRARYRKNANHPFWRRTVLVTSVQWDTLTFSPP